MKPVLHALLVLSAVLAGCAGLPPPSPATFTGRTKCNGEFCLQKESADGLSVVRLQTEYDDLAKRRLDIRTPDTWHAFDVSADGWIGCHIHLWQYTPDAPLDVREHNWSHFAFSGDERHCAGFWTAVDGRLSVRYSTNATSGGRAAVASFEVTDLRVRDHRNMRYGVPDFSIPDVEVTHHLIE